MQPAVGFSDTGAAGGAAEPTAGEVAVPTAGEVAVPTAGEVAVPTAGEVAVPTAGEVAEDGEDGEDGEEEEDGDGDDGSDDGSVRYLLEQALQNQQHLTSIRDQYAQLIRDATSQMTQLETRIAACHCAVVEVQQAWNMMQSGGGVGWAWGTAVGKAWGRPHPMQRPTEGLGRSARWENKHYV